MQKKFDPMNTQVGGGHYRAGGIQPVEYIEANSLGFLEGCVVKRLTRHNRDGGKGVQDIDKAIHELQLLKALRYPEKEEPEIPTTVDVDFVNDLVRECRASFFPFKEYYVHD